MRPLDCSTRRKLACSCMSALTSPADVLTHIEETYRSRVSHELMKFSVICDKNTNNRESAIEILITLNWAVTLDLNRSLSVCNDQ